MVANIYLTCSHKPISARTVLEKTFFNKASGRSLILQPSGEFGYFYVPVPVYDDPLEKQENVQKLIDLLALMAFLRSQGLIIVFDIDSETCPAMRFIGQQFQNPKASTAHIVLNALGDFTFDPQTIQNANDAVIFKGIRLTGDLYSLAEMYTTGLIYAVPKMKDFVLFSARQAAKSTQTFQGQVAGLRL
jgi:hypothetical protein